MIDEIKLEIDVLFEEAQSLHCSKRFSVMEMVEAEYQGKIICNENDYEGKN